MRLFTSIGLSASCGFLMASLMRESASLFHLEEVTNADRYVTTELNTTRGMRALHLSPLQQKANGTDAELSTFSPPSCTADQLDMIYQRLPEVGENCGNQTGLCPISFITGCPHSSWLEDHYVAQHEQRATKKSFLAINIGCNKGYDAVKLLRMGSNNPAINRLAWKEAMPINTRPGICGQDNELSTPLTPPPSSEEFTESNLLVYCIEPMTSTFQALQSAAQSTGWDSQLKILQLAMNNEDPSTVLFPKPTLGNVGVEAVGIFNNCPAKPDDCVDVESSRLDFMMSKEHLTDNRVNVLLIDVEGFDFDVLQGGSTTLRNTEYVEFEFHKVGKWGSDFKLGKKPLKIAIEYLDELDFTCYWAGRGELWRITGCWLPHYGGAFWSNVACANRRLAPSLLQKMEAVFLDTVSTPLYPKPPIDVSKFLVSDSDRYDMILLLDVDGNQRYQLIVVDRSLGRSTSITYPTCVLLDPPREPQPDRKGELQVAAERMGCARIIAVDRQPLGVSMDGVEKELHHVVRVIAQNGFFLGDMLKLSFNDVHFYSESRR
ncbi:methyltransferase [Fragilaria crotonensis]|nr:methyltransferase [Fragilaria crotonensis]